MNNIVERLKEKRDIEIAKSILESHGYIVSKDIATDTIRETHDLQSIIDAPFSSSFMDDGRASLVINGNTYVKIGKDKWEYQSPNPRVLGGTYTNQQIYDKLTKSKEDSPIEESTGTRKWSGYRKVPGDVCLQKWYTDDTSSLVGVVYQPDGDEYDTYGVEIYDNNTDHRILQSGWSAPDFDTEEEAMQWVEDWFRNEEEWMPESKDSSLQEGTNDILDKYGDIASEIREQIKDAFTSYMKDKGWTEEDMKDLYSGVDVTFREEGYLLVEVYAELSYKSMVNLAYRLDPLIQTYDKDAYFDMEDTGRMSAWISLSELDKVD